MTAKNIPDTARIIIDLKAALPFMKKTSPATPPIIQSTTRLVPIASYTDEARTMVRRGIMNGSADPDAIPTYVPLPNPARNVSIV
jgi:hypothetical protein